MGIRAPTSGTNVEAQHTRRLLVIIPNCSPTAPLSVLILKHVRAWARRSFFLWAEVCLSRLNFTLCVLLYPMHLHACVNFFWLPLRNPSLVLQSLPTCLQYSRTFYRLAIDHYWPFGSMLFREHIFRGCKSTVCLFSQPFDLAIRQRLNKAETPHY